MDSQVYKDLTAKIDRIAKFVTALGNKAEGQPEDGWVDSCEVCTFLKISTKTLQRLRSNNEISFSKIRGKIFYRISEIERLLNDHIIHRSDEHLQGLIRNHRLQIEKKRAIKPAK